MLDKIEDTCAVPGFVVVPRHKFDKVVRQGDAGLFIKNRRVAAGDEVTRDHVLVLVSQNALHTAFRRGLDGGTNVTVRSALRQASCQIDHTHVDGGDAETALRWVEREIVFHGR